MSETRLLVMEGAVFIYGTGVVLYALYTAACFWRSLSDKAG